MRTEEGGALATLRVRYGDDRVLGRTRTEWVCATLWGRWGGAGREVRVRVGGGGGASQCESCVGWRGGGFGWRKRSVGKRKWGVRPE